jgi:hypothetical protein
MIRPWLVLILGLLLSGCGGSFATIGDSNSQTNLPSNDEPTDTGGGDQGNTPAETPAVDFKPTICSDLSFDEVKWPENVSTKQLDAFALAMNITGSFEGHNGWNNIANNFDGQGLSLGLFNQNFGQGTLQPLMIEYSQSTNHKMNSLFSAAQKTSLTAMLNAWLTAQGGVLSKAKNQFIPDTSPLDTDYDAFLLSKASNETNQDSVDWAVAQLYSGTQFKPEWKLALQNLAKDSGYVTLQIDAAISIHNKAMGYVKKYGFKTRYAYLFFFDIVVQNGGISSTTEAKYLSWEKTNKTAAESTKLLKLLEYRLLVVNPTYVADVRSRKTSIIKGTGTVHGSSRNYPQEYCAPAWGASIF